MLPNKVLEQQPSNDDNIILAGKGDVTIKFIASNLKTAHRWTHDTNGYQQSLNFCCSKNSSGIIILRVGYSTGIDKSKSWNFKYFLLGVSDGKVNFDKYWEPQKPGRLIAVRDTGQSKDDCIEIISETCERYTTNPQPAPGEYYVPDANLLCKYVSGQVEENVLQEAATLQAEEISAREKLPELEIQLREEREYSKQLNFIVKGSESEIEKLQKKLEIQAEYAKDFCSKFEFAQLTAYDMRTQLLPALPLIKRFQDELYHHVKSAIKLADKEIPRN